MTVDLPQARVQIAVGATLGTLYDDLTWVDVTDRVRLAAGIRFVRGRSGAGQPATPGQCRFTLRNDDGAWNPGSPITYPQGDPDWDTAEWAAGEFGQAQGTAGTFTVRTPVRVEALAGAVWHPLWLGFITDIEWQADSGEVRVSVDAADTLSRAARVLTRPWMQSMTMLTDPFGYWPLDDGTGSTAAANKREIDYDGSPLDLRADVLSPSGLTASKAYATWQLPGPHPDSTSLALTPYVDESAADYIGWRLSGPVGLGLDTVYWLTAWVQPEPDRPCTVLAYDSDQIGATNNRWMSQALVVTVLDGGRQVKVEVYWGRSTSYAIPTATIQTDIDADGWLHVALKVNPRYRASLASSPWQASDFQSRFGVYVNGQLAPGLDCNDVIANTDLPYSETSSGTLTIGGHRMNKNYPLSGRVAHVTTVVASAAPAPPTLPSSWDTPPDPRLYDRATADDTASRFTKLASCTAAGTAMESWMRVDPGGSYGMSAQPLADRYLLDVLQDVAATARGSVVAAATGHLVLKPSRTRYTVTPVLTLDARRDVISGQGAFGMDDTAAVDEVSVTQQPSGATVTAQREGGTGLESGGLTLWTDSSTHAESVAAGLANGPTITRSPRLVVSMHHAAQRGLSGQLLALELGDLIRVENMPAAAPQGTMLLTVETIEHQIGPGDWVVVLDTGPGELADAACVGSSGPLSTVSPTLTIRA